MGIIKTVLGSIFYFGGIITFFWGLYTLVSTMLGTNDQIAFAGAIAGIGFVAIIVGVVSYFLGKFLLK